MTTTQDDYCQQLYCNTFYTLLEQGFNVKDAIRYASLAVDGFRAKFG